MKNPYWSSEGQTHPVSVDDIKRLCFEIVNIVAASGELASEATASEEEGEPKSAIFQLHHEYAEKELCKKVLQLAVLVRTFDDIASTSDRVDEYNQHAKETNGNDFIGHLNVDGKAAHFNLREACNKIIHAQEIRPLYDDLTQWSADEIVDRRWYCDGEIELKGTQFKKNWDASVRVYEFVETILARIQFRF